MNKDLIAHLPFCLKMLQKVKNTSFENKWKTLYDIISSGKELTKEKAEAINNTLKGLKSKLENVQPSQSSPLQKHVERQGKEAEVHVADKSDINSLKISLSINAEKKPISAKKRNRKKTKLPKILQPRANKKEEKINVSNSKLLDNFTSFIDPAITLPAPVTPILKKVSTKRPSELQPLKVPPLKIRLSAIFKTKHEKRMMKAKKHLKQSINVKSRQEIQSDLSIEPLTKASEIVNKSNISLNNCFVRLDRWIAGEETFNVSSLISTATTTQSVSQIIPLKKIKTETVENPDSLTSSTSILVRENSVSKIISHMSYVILNNELRMQCSLCNYTSKDKVLFRSHLASSHANNRWFGSCQSCSHLPKYKNGSITDEFDHMINFHTYKEKPAPMISIPNNLLDEMKSKKTESQNSSILLSSSSTYKKLRPWMTPTPNGNQKFLDICESMLELTCLSALFKCMSVGCLFHTSDVKLFEQHLSLHLQYHKTDFANFSLCAYCDFAGSPLSELSDLVNHIVNVHSADKYQCFYCFYRSCDLQVQTHLNLHHKNKKEIFIKLRTNFKGQNLNQELIDVWEKVNENVPRMTCMKCKEKFYNFGIFINHLNEHKDLATATTKCVKCNEQISVDSVLHHLKICHGFGNRQCAFCRFGTDSHAVFMAHIVNNHPSKMPLMFDRTCGPKSDKRLLPCNSSQPSIALKKLVLPLSSRFVMRKSLEWNAEAMINAKNVNKLSRNYQINLNEVLIKK